MPHVLFIKGFQNDNWVRVFKNAAGRNAYQFSGTCNLLNLFSHKDFTKEQLVIHGSEKQGSYKIKQPPSVVFNEISDSDSHSHALNGAITFCKNLQQQHPCTVINPPKYVYRTARDQIYERLHDVPGLWVPRTLRLPLSHPHELVAAAKEHDLTWPLLVRITGTHQGRSLTLLNTKKDLALLDALPMDGRDFYITEFIDFKDKDGLYRKFRVMVIAGKPYFVSLLVADQWLIHGAQRQAMEENPAWAQEDVEMYQAYQDRFYPLLKPIAAKVYKKLGLHYFGIDCSLRSDGRLLAFEINANMNVFALRNRVHLKPRVKVIADSVAALVAKQVKG